jgi:hypothetical protein
LILFPFKDENWKKFLKEKKLMCLLKMHNVTDASERKNCCTKSSKYILKEKIIAFSEIKK